MTSYVPKFGFHIAHLVNDGRRRLFVAAREGHVYWAPYSHVTETGEWVSLSPMSRPQWYPTAEHAQPDLERMVGRYGRRFDIVLIDCNTGEPEPVVLEAAQIREN